MGELVYREFTQGRIPSECKRIFSSRYEVDGSVGRYKLQLVAKGTHIQCIDFRDEFYSLLWIITIGH